MMNQRNWAQRAGSWVALLLTAAVSAGLASAATCPSDPPTSTTSVLNYPLPSPNYAVQYRVGSGPWTPATTYISVYGGTLASPYRGDSGYISGQTSLSFVNIPLQPLQSSTPLQIRVTKLYGAPFSTSDNVAVRPSVKQYHVQTLAGGDVHISTVIPLNFSGEQFILWWDSDADNAGIEALAFFLNPSYPPPTQGVLTVTNYNQLCGGLSSYTALDFEGVVTIGGTGEFTVPANILTIFLGPGAWVKGKFKFSAATSPPGQLRQIYGPGVLDLSLFDYTKRTSPGAQGDYALTTDAANHVLDNFLIQGIMISDLNHAANDILFNSIVENVKVLGWNAENAALRLGNNTGAYNVFIRSGDDSLMMWGEPVGVTNATVWQNYNGGVVNLGWSNNSTGKGSGLDGLYVVKTDWSQPLFPGSPWVSTAPDQLDNQNNAVFASLMTPGTKYGIPKAPVFQNILVEDPPNVLFSLKILPPICADTGMTCPSFTLASSMVNLTIENLHSPQSIVDNAIGFQTLTEGFTPSGVVVPSTAPVPA